MNQLDALRQQMDNAIMSTIQNEQTKRNLREWNPYHPPAPVSLVFSSVVFRDMMKERKMRYGDMAKLTKLSTSFISEVAKGVTNPSEKTMDKIASAFGCEIEDLFVVCDFE